MLQERFADDAPRPWVCLMYHDVTAERPLDVGDYFSVSDSSFTRHLDAIQELQLRGCSITQAIEQPGNAVAISFDDGNVGQAVRAFPALVAHQMTATFFVTTSWVGRPGYASWQQLEEMKGAGMSIQSHTHSHPFLSELDAAGVREELRRARGQLEDRLQQRTTMLALPGGDWPRTALRHIIAEEGYEVVATSRWGTNGPHDARMPFGLKRCTVRGNPDDATFSAIVRGDAWLKIRKQAREHVLAFVRASLGPSRYARWRRSVLNDGQSVG